MPTMTLDDITRLSPQERIALIAQLWDSLAEGDLPLTQAQRDELERRLARLDAERAEAVSWETLQAQLDERCA